MRESEDRPGQAGAGEVAELDGMPQGMTEEEFLQDVLAHAPEVAVFDCDGTLWSRDAGSMFLTWSLQQGMVSRETADWILGRYSEYRRGTVTEVEICGQMTQMYAGLREEEMRASAARFFREQIAGSVFGSMQKLVRKLAEQGVELWAVSSTNVWVIEAGLREFGIGRERILATELVVRDGVLTDALVAVPSGEGKRESLLRVEVARPHAVFGNSVHDAAMLAMASAAYAVNPSEALLAMAGSQGWPVYWPQGSR